MKTKADTKKSTTPEAPKSMAERFPLNIEPELWAAWKQAKRNGDVKDLVKRLKRSRPIIDRALKYGHVKEAGLVPKITKFFNQRSAGELEGANEILERSAK